MNDATKYLIYLTLSLLLATGAMWFVGGQKQEYSTQMTIKAPPERVFRYLSDPDLLQKWSAEIVEVEPYEGEQSDVGAITELVIESKGRQVTMRQEVIKFEQDDMISLQRSNDFIRTTAIFRLSSEGDETNLTYRVKENRIGVNRVTGFFERGDKQATIDEEIRKLKKLVESEIDQDLGALPDAAFRLAPLPVSDDADEKTQATDSGQDSTGSEPSPKPLQQNRPERVFDDQ